MKIVSAMAAMVVATAGPAMAQDLVGDAESGATLFDRQCVACHVVADETGEILAGRNAHTGPNLFGVIGRVPGSLPDFEFGDSLVEYGQTGVVWDQVNFTGYIQNPTDFLRTALDDRRARGKMAFQVRDPQDAADIYAFLATFPAAAAQ